MSAEILSRKSAVVVSDHFGTSKVLHKHCWITVNPVAQMIDTYCWVLLSRDEFGMKQSKQASSIKHEHAIFDKQKLEMVGTAFWVTREIEKEFCSHPSILKIGLWLWKKNKFLVTHKHWDFCSISGSCFLVDGSVFPFVLCVRQRWKYLKLWLLISYSLCTEEPHHISTGPFRSPHSAITRITTTSFPGFVWKFSVYLDLSFTNSLYIGWYVSPPTPYPKQTRNILMRPNRWRCLGLWYSYSLSLSEKHSYTIGPLRKCLITFCRRHTLTLEMFSLDQ